MNNEHNLCMHEFQFVPGFCHEDKGHKGDHECEYNGEIYFAENVHDDEFQGEPKSMLSEVIAEFEGNITNKLGNLASLADALYGAGHRVQEAWEKYAADTENPDNWDGLRDSIVRYLVPCLDAVRGEKNDWCTDPECLSVDVNHTH